MRPKNKTKIHIIGAGGHAKVVIQTARTAGLEPIAVFDDNEQLHGSDLCHVPIIGEIEQLRKHEIPCVIAIGNNDVRKRIADKYDFNWHTVIHPSTIIDPTVRIGRGTVVFAAIAIQVDASIGDHAIINTSASVDHDCLIGDFVHIAPNSTLTGGVQIGEGTLLGAGVTVKPYKTIGKWSVIGAGLRRRR